MKNQILDINAIYDSKEYVKNGETMKSPRAILEPIFQEGLNNDLEVISFISPDYIVQVGEEGNKLTSYGRAGVKLRLKLDEELSYDIGFLYAYDLKTSFIKVYRGANVYACSNLCVFGASDSQKFELHENNLKVSTEKIQEFLRQSYVHCQMVKGMIAELKGTILTAEQVVKFLGFLVKKMTEESTLAGTTIILNSAKLLFGPKIKSPYFIGDKNTTAWNVFNSLTDYFREKSDLFDQPEKVLEIYDLFKEFEIIENLNMEFTEDETVTDNLLIEG